MEPKKWLRGNKASPLIVAIPYYLMQYLIHPHRLECDNSKGNLGNPTELPALFFAVEIHSLHVCIGLALTVLITNSIEIAPANLVIVFLGHLGNITVVQSSEIRNDNNRSGGASSHVSFAVLDKELILLAIV